MISGAAWAADLYAQFTGIGFDGAQLSNFTSFVGNGSANHVIGQSFMTMDTGVVAGSGMGTGMGITGISSSNISDNIYSLCVQSFGQAGPKLRDFTDAIGRACVTALGQATLMSTDSPVFAGTGMIDIGSITVSGDAWGSSIETQGASFVGSQWPNFTKAIGQGQAMEVLAAGTGTLTITGTGSPGSPGTGTGTGTIS